MEELLKIKHELTKERDEKLSEIARVRVFDFIFSIQIFFRSFTCSVNFHEPANVHVGKQCLAWVLGPPGYRMKALGIQTGGRW